MSWELAAALFAFVIIAGVGAGLALRYGVNPEPADRAPPPPPPAGFRPRDARHHVPMFSTYDGASRLQRAAQAAHNYITDRGASTAEIDAANGYRRYGLRPHKPIDVDAMTMAIITAWIGEEEPMVRVPIMKLGDIKVERNQAAIDEAIEKITPIGVLRDRVTRADLEQRNRDRERAGLPPLATGGMVEPGKPYIVGETPSEQTRPLSDHPDQGDA